MSGPQDEEVLFPAMEHSIAECQTKQQRRRFIRLEDRLLMLQASAMAHRRPGWQIRGLPADVEVLAVHYEHLWKAFCVVLCSMEWERVAEFEQIPEAVVELVEAPGEETQYVLWRELKSTLEANQKAIPAPEACDLVKEWHEEAEED